MTLNRVTIRLPDLELSILTAEADERGIPLAAYIRYILLMHIEREDIDNRINAAVDSRIEAYFKKMETA